MVGQEAGQDGRICMMFDDRLMDTAADFFMSGQGMLAAGCGCCSIELARQILFSVTSLS
jgi:hypothetical protein